MIGRVGNVSVGQVLQDQLVTYVCHMILYKLYITNLVLC